MHNCQIFLYLIKLKTKQYANINSKRIRENIHSPRYGGPRGIFVTIAGDFQIILKLEDTRFYVGGFLY